jgi:hypothetical protein
MKLNLKVIYEHHGQCLLISMLMIAELYQNLQQKQDICTQYVPHWTKHKMTVLDFYRIS